MNNLIIRSLIFAVIAKVDAVTDWSEYYTTPQEDGTDDNKSTLNLFGEHDMIRHRKQEVILFSNYFMSTGDFVESYSFFNEHNVDGPKSSKSKSAKSDHTPKPKSSKSNTPKTAKSKTNKPKSAKPKGDKQPKESKAPSFPPMSKQAKGEDPPSSPSIAPTAAPTSKDKANEDATTVNMNSTLEWNITCSAFDSVALLEVAKIVEKSIFEGMDPQLSNEVLEYVSVPYLCGKRFQSHPHKKSSIRDLQNGDAMSQILVEMQITESECLESGAEIFNSANTALGSIVSDGTLTSNIRRNSMGQIQAVVNPNTIISSYTHVTGCPAFSPSTPPSAMSSQPSTSPTLPPTPQPSAKPSSAPSSSPSVHPTACPTSAAPSISPSISPTVSSIPPSRTPTSAPTQRDIYRTCFQRAIDPSNNLTEDTILRDMNSTETHCESLAHVHSPPYVTENEERTYGTVYLSIVRNNNTNLTCNDQLDLEELALKWLYDNLGGEDSFIPVCVYNDDYALYNEVATNNDGLERVIHTAGFKLDFVFATNIYWLNQTHGEEVHGRGLKSNDNECSAKEFQQCCTADAYNGLSKDEKKQKKAYCKLIGCKKCPKKKKERYLFGRKTDGFRALQNFVVQRLLIDEDLYGTDFNDALIEYTDLEPNSTGAVLNATNVEDLAICRASNYNVSEYETPSLGCGEYLEYDCEANDYIIVQSNETNATEVCLPEPTQSPSSSPTIAPTSSPSSHPSTSPSLSPSSPPSESPSTSPISTMPSRSPSRSPALLPTMSPTNTPSKSPTKSPSTTPLSPSASPSHTPSSQPTKAPSTSPTSSPSAQPSRSPSLSPSASPSQSPSSKPTVSPSLSPSVSCASPPIYLGNQTKLFACDAESYDHFGVDVSAGPGILAIGANKDKSNFMNVGAVYILTMKNSTGKWEQSAHLKPSDSSYHQYFGSSVYIDGDTLAVGSPHDERNGSGSGAVYVFRHDKVNNQWIQEAKLHASDGSQYDKLGTTVAISGNVIVAGAPSEHITWPAREGAAYVFELDANTSDWNEVAKLVAPKRHWFDEFGSSVDVSGSIIAVGVPFDNVTAHDDGSVFIYENSLNGAWIETAMLTANDGRLNDNFGSSVSLSGHTLAVGAKGADAAYIFEKSNSTGIWSQVAKLTANDGTNVNWFGASVSIQDSTVAVGANNQKDNGYQSGAVYVFTLDKSTGNWTQTSKYLATDGAEGDKMGESVSLHENIVIAGARYTNDLGNETGSAYVFNLD